MKGQIQERMSGNKIQEVVWLDWELTKRATEARELRKDGKDWKAKKNRKCRKDKDGQP